MSDYMTVAKSYMAVSNRVLEELSTNEINEIDDDFKALFDWVQVIKIADNPLYVGRRI